MKQKLLLKTMLLLCALIVGSNARGQQSQEVTITMSQQGWSNDTQIGSGTLKSAANTNSIFTYSSGTGDDGASEGPKYFTSGTNIRFYSKKNGDGNGNYMQINVPSNTTITGIEITGDNNYTPDVKYNVDGGSDVSWTASNNKYTVSNISATTSFKFRNAYKNTSDNKQLRITAIKITYTTSSGGGSEPSITLGTYSVNAPATAVSTTSIEVTYNNLTDYESEVNFYESDGETEATYDHSWLTARIDEDTKNLTYSMIANTGAARTAYLKVYALGDEGDAESDLITITQAAHTYIISAQSNNNSYGTVVLNGTVITATPASGYRYANPAYTVSSGSATVVQNGNEFTVTPSSDCTVTINFEAIPTHTVTYSVNGVTARQDFAEGTAITFPSNPADISGKKFVGWAETSISGTTNTAPTFVTSATMGNSDIIYYAVFADVTGTTAASWTATELGSLTSSDIFVIVGNNGNTYALTSANATSTGPLVSAININNGKIDETTTPVTDALKFNISGNSSDGYTFYPNGSTTKFIYCTDTNNGVRVGTPASNTTEDHTFTLTSGYLTASFTSGNTTTYRCIGIYDSKDWRCYSSTSQTPIHTNIANQTFAYYKYTAGSATYGNYCTTVVVTYSVTYDANGATSGDVPTDATAYSPNATVTVLGNTGNLAKTGYAFGGWNTLANGEGTNYAADATFNITGNTTLYAKWTPYTITAASNNNSYGTVELSGYVITATPEEGYTYASPAYTVSSGSATVVQNGNEFTVTPTSNCTVTINFAAIPTHTATFSVNGATTSNTFYEGQAIAFPNVPAVGGYDFIGWATAEITGTAATVPTTVTAATMGTADVTYYAVYGDVENVTATFDASDISNLTSTATNTWTDNETGIVLEISDGQRYTGASPYTWTVTQSTSDDDYCLTIGRENCQLKRVIVTVSESDYSVSDYYAYEEYTDEYGTDMTNEVTTNGLVSTLTLVDSYELVALWSSTNNQIRATKVEVEAEIPAYLTTLPSVTISSFGWATYIAEKNVYFNSDVTAYIATGNSGNSVTLTEVAAVEKGTPVVVKAKNAIESSQTFTLETVDADDCDDVSANLLEVCDGSAAAEGYNYFVLAKDDTSACFKQWTGVLSSLNGRVVLPLQLDLTTQGGARALNIVFSGEATGIDTIEHSTMTIDSYYNLSGQRVDNPKKGGLYIMNGKKVVIK